MALEEKVAAAEVVALVEPTNVSRSSAASFNLPDEEAEFVVPLDVSIQVRRIYKGQLPNAARLLELFGIGTGYAGMIPGVRYVIAIPPRRSMPVKAPAYYVSRCDVLLSFISWNGPGVREELARIEQLAATP